MRNLVTSYKSARKEEMDELGSKALSGNLTRTDYRRLLAIMAGGLSYHGHYPDAVLEMLYGRSGRVSSFDLNMLRVAIHKHQDVLMPICDGMKPWQEMFSSYPGMLSLDNGTERMERVSAWKKRIADYHARRRAGQGGVADEQEGVL